MNKKKYAEFLEEVVKSAIENFNKNFTQGFYVECATCGGMSPDNEMESVLFDDEKSPSLICRTCFYGVVDEEDKHNKTIDDLDTEPGMHEDYYESLESTEIK